MKGIKKVLSFLMTAIFVWMTFSVVVLAQLPDIRLSIDSENKELRKVLDELTLITGYFFTYDASVIDDQKKVSIDIQDGSLINVLDSLLNDHLLTYSLVDRNIVIYRRATEFAGNDNELQKPFVVKGEITDDRSGKALEFATVAINGSHLGTISNQSGVFRLTIPPDEKEQILVVSMMGYENEYIYIRDLQDQNLKISLKPRIIPIQEVIIRYSDPEEILNKVIDQIDDNYMDQHSLMNAYFREYTRKNRKYLTFSEAVLEIAKEPYSNPFRSDEVRIIQGRKMINVNQEDSLLLKLQAGIHSSLLLDVIKNPLQFLSHGFEEYYDIEFSDIIYFKNNLVYVIDFRQKDFIKRSLYQGQLYISIHDLALLAVDFELNPRYIRKEAASFFVKKSPRIRMTPTRAVYHTEYRKTNQRYHLSMVRGEVNFRVRKKREWIGSLFDISIEMAVTNVNPGEKIKIERKEQLRPGTVLSEEIFLNDPDFWKGYNIIQPEVSLQEALKRMGMNWERIESDSK